MFVYILTVFPITFGQIKIFKKLCNIALNPCSIFMKAGPDTISMMVDTNSALLKRMYKEPVGCLPTSNDTEVNALS